MSIRSLICRCAFCLLALTTTTQIIVPFLIALFSPKCFMWIEHTGHWTWDCPLLVAKITECGLFPLSNLTLYLLRYQDGWKVASSLNPVLTAKVHRLQVWKEHHNKVYKKRVCLRQLNVATVSIYNLRSLMILPNICTVVCYTPNSRTACLQLSFHCNKGLLEVYSPEP